MKMFKIIFVLALCALNYHLEAQIIYSPFTNDAVRMSQTAGGGTARFEALGGANVSLGGDISSISANPAGLGFYNKSAWAISPVLRVGDFNASYLGENSSNMGINLQVPNMGAVFHNRFEEYAGTKWVSGTFGLAINQKASYYNNINYEGTVNTDPNTGFVNDFVEYTLSPFLNADGTFKRYPTQADYDQEFLANPYSDVASYVGLLTIFDVEDENGNFAGYEVDRYDFDQISNARQTENINTSGGLTTLDVSYGANYNDRLFLGAALNIHFLNFRQVRTFRESPENGILNYLELREENQLSGSGLGVTVGAIYKPLDILNLGVSYSSPTFMAITEIQDISIATFFVNGDNLEHSKINEVPSYSFIIPQKVSAGATVFLNKFGFLTADIEYVDYESARFNSSNDAFGTETPDVSRDLNSTYNIKLGAEARLNMFRLRAGYAYYDNPYVELFTQGRDAVSGGVGIFKNGFTADLTYSLSRFNNPTITPYAGGNPIVSNSNISNFRLTLGKSF